ncbi:MAG: stimulus-sensing domain-containing protein [Alphaproteobacteria bacterium]
MESDINTKKKADRSLANAKAEGSMRSKGSPPDLDQILDLYWGGTERRITGLTLRIIAVNAVALLILLLGILYLGQSQNSLIEAKLETFQAEVELISAALSEGAVEEYQIDGENILDPPLSILAINPDLAVKMVRRLSKSMDKRIRLFNESGIKIADSHVLTGPGGKVQIVDLNPPNDGLYTIQILKDVTATLISFLPDRRILPQYPDDNIQTAQDNLDTVDAMMGKISISAWTNENNRIFLSAAAPIMQDRQILGSVLLTRVATDIEDGVIAVWFDILRVFVVTLTLTILLSIYLSGAIARPLKKLARAAEKIRSDHSRNTEIPDFSYRHDEIGDLSVVLRDMTEELSKRMSSIESFAADVAHELKNPLTSLKSAIETLMIVNKKEDRAKLLKIITHDIERLDRLITDISRASRLDTEMSRESMERLNIKDILFQILEMYRDPLDREDNLLISKATSIKTDNDVHIILDTGNEEDQDCFIIGNEGRLTQVFQNILNNALSFSRPGGIIRIEVARRLNAVIVSIEDEGPGIPPAKLGTIFERFYSERPKYEEYGQHSGLGLSICKQIIEAHQGRIFAENRKDLSGKILGAKFTVILSRIEP